MNGTHALRHSFRPGSSLEQKLEQSVTRMTDESKKQHEDVMAALKHVRIYKKTLDQDQLKS